MHELEKETPLISVGIPVYNGENYLKEAIESVLAQTYRNWELIISDNGSTDSTQKICEQFVKQDSRIKYSRFSKNQGAARNYNRVFELAGGKYFKWLPHDDMISTNNLTESVQVLENNSDVVLCGSAKMHIDSNGNKIDINNYSGLHLSQEDINQRYKAFLQYFSKSFSNADFIMGLIRSDALNQTNLIGNYAADFILLGELITKGKFSVLNEALYIRRIHHGISTSIYNNKPDLVKNIDPTTKIKHKTNVEIIKWYDPKGKVKYIPHFNWLYQLNESLKKESLNRNEKYQLSMSLYKWFIVKFFFSIRDKFSKILAIN